MTRQLLQDHFLGQAIGQFRVDRPGVPDHRRWRPRMPIARRIIGSESAPASQASTSPASRQSPEPIGFWALIAGGTARNRFSRTWASTG